MDPIIRWLLARYQEVVQWQLDLESLMGLIGHTPLWLSADNAVVVALWRGMCSVAGVLLGLFVLITLIQAMYGEHTGTLHLPLGPFIGKAILTAILIPFSATICRDLLYITNVICGTILVDLQTFVQQSNLQGVEISFFQVLLGFAFLFSFLRVILRSVGRIVLFNLVFVMSGPCLLASLHPATAPIFSAWARLLVLLLFEQWLQWVAFSLSIQFLLSIGQNTNVTTDFLMAIAALNLIADIPSLLARFGASTGGGLGSLIRMGLGASVILK